MVVVDATVRLLPGALSHGSAEEESFSSGLLEYPQYTRPAAFRGWEVPEVLRSGNHQEVARWRRRESLRATTARRPDLLAQVELSDWDRAALEGLDD
jgi:tRNA (guanine37-N1)-methyltransferase